MEQHSPCDHPTQVFPAFVAPQEPSVVGTPVGLGVVLVEGEGKTGSPVLVEEVAVEEGGVPPVQPD